MKQKQEILLAHWLAGCIYHYTWPMESGQVARVEQVVDTNGYDQRATRGTFSARARGTYPGWRALPALPTPDELTAAVPCQGLIDRLDLCLPALRHGPRHEHENCLIIGGLAVTWNSSSGEANHRAQATPDCALLF